jgi:WD40 repeat protein
MGQTHLIGIGGVNTVVWSPDGSQIALGSTDGIFLYDAASLQRITHISTNEWVETVNFSADGTVIVSGLRDGKVIAWDAATRQKKFEVAYRQADNPKEKERLGVTASPVLAVAISQSETFLAVGHENGTLTVWDIEGGQPSAVFTHDQYKTVTGLAFSTDGRTLYGSNNTSQLFAWDVNSGQKSPMKAVLSSMVRTLVSSKDGSYLLAGGDGQSVFVIDPISDRTLTSFPNPGGTVGEVAISDDSARVAVGLANGQVNVFAMPGMDQLSGAHLPLYSVSGNPDAITGVGFSPDGTRLISSSWKEGLKLWEAATGAVMPSLNESMVGIYRLVFSLDDKWLAAGYDNNLVRIWNTSDATLFHTYTGQIPLGNPFSPKQHYLVLVDEAKNVWEDGPIYIIAYPSGELIKTLKGYRRGWQISFDPEEKMLVIGNTREAYIWDTSTWEKLKIQGGYNGGCGLFNTPEFENLALIWEKAIIFQINETMFTLCANKPSFADPMYLFQDRSTAIYQNKAGILWLWNLDPDTIIEADPHGLKMPEMVLLAMSANDQMALYSRDNIMVALSTVNKSGFLQKWVFPRQADYQYRAAFSNNNTLVALGSRFGTITVWSAR